MNGIGRSRAAIGDRLGSENLTKLESEVFARVLRECKDREELTTIIEDIEVSPISPSRQPARKLGVEGSAEIIAKLGMFLSLMHEEEIFTRRK